MPLITGAKPEAPVVTGIVPAAAGLRVTAYAPADADVRGIPATSTVVAWAVVSDLDALGGVRLDPVFLADGRTWTPDQFRAAYGNTLTLQVGPA